MESVLVHDTAQAGNSNEKESSEKFQKYIYEIFDQNGILNDLRAYLRGHIVNVLKSARTGEPLPCQTHFTQRLELPYQALNILIAEYLLRLEFSYSLSVFVSEIPLANMVFAFAKTLMQNVESDHANLKFKDSDVWSILNYLGVKCDSQHALNIAEIYKSEESTPLLFCILKCMPMYNGDPVIKTVKSSAGSITSSVKSSDSYEEKGVKHTHENTSYHAKCRHYAQCKTCRNKISRMKEKYKKKKKEFANNTRECDLNPTKVETLLKKIGVMERSLIEEMFEQLKTVYEEEVELVKAEQESRIKKAIASHAIQLQKRRNEMEESFKAREQELERNVQQKKKFLWGLARALRDHHGHMMKAMHDVKMETKRLSDKEESLKTQIADAEQLLKQRSEDLRVQISKELHILESHLESMKKERDNINRERNELEQLRNITETNNQRLKLEKSDNEDVKNHYELLKNELNILKKYIEATRCQPKCVIERSTITDLYDVSSKLNNSHDVECLRSDDDKLKNQVVNELKKPKNVNFSQSNLDEIYRERSRDRSRSSASSEAGDANNMRFEDQAARHLNEENERLKTFVRQQREHIDELLSQQARLQAELTATRFRTAADEMPAWRPRTAPTVMPRQSYNFERLNTSTSVNSTNYGWRKGAGEQLSLFSNAEPRILVPEDAVPFIGVLTERHTDCRRHLINQWRTLRRRVSPLKPPKPRNHSQTQTDQDVDGEMSSNVRQDSTTPVPDQEGTTYSLNERRERGGQLCETFESQQPERPSTAGTSIVKSNREKSPKFVLMAAKQKLKNNDTTKETLRNSSEKSPNTVLREAKLRLRKLEIEAEAVEQSYMQFRKRQSLLKENRSNVLHTAESVTKDVVGEIDINQSKFIQKSQVNNLFEIPARTINVQQLAKTDTDKYLKSYQNIDLTETYFKNSNKTAVKINPIPAAYKNIGKFNENKNYLETPLTEFRKLYNSGKRTVNIERNINNRVKIDDKNIGNESRVDERSLDNPLENISNGPISTITVTSDNNENNGNSRNGELKRAKNNDKVELEIVKQNINKIYNSQEPVINKSPKNRVGTPLSQCGGSELDLKSNADDTKISLKIQIAKISVESSKLVTEKFNENRIETTQAHRNTEVSKSNHVEMKSILKSEIAKEIIESPVNISIMSQLGTQDSNDHDLSLEPNRMELEKRIKDDKKSPKSIDKVDNIVYTVDKVNNEVKSDIVIEDNILKGMAENVKDSEKAEITPVNSDLDAKRESDINEIPEMKIIISQKDEHSPEHRTFSAEEAAKLTQNDVLESIFQKEVNDQSSIQMNLELSNDVLEDSVSDFGKRDDYKDDFSADVDNYNSRSDYENDILSPVSIAKTSDDENFWES